MLPQRVQLRRVNDQVIISKKETKVQRTNRIQKYSTVQDVQNKVYKLQFTAEYLGEKGRYTLYREN